MSYSKEVLGFDVLESVEYINSGTAVSLEYKNNRIYIKPASSSEQIIGITLEDYVRGQASSKIPVSVIAFSRALAGGTFSAGDLVGISNNGEFIKSNSDVKAFAVAITDGYIGKYFQLLNINIQGSGSSGVSSVNGMSGDVVIEANNILANVDNSMKQGAFNNAMNDAVNTLCEEIEKKQNKLIAGNGIEIADNTISLALEKSINTSIPSGVSNLICSITNMSDLFLIVALSFKTTADFSNFYIPLSKAILKKMGAGVYPVVYNDQAKGERIVGLKRDTDNSLYVSSWNGNFTQNILINLNTVIVLNP